MQYYVYLYIDPRTSLPFYVGKGIGDRKYHHLSETLTTTINKRKYYRIQSIRRDGLEPIIEERYSELKEADAYRIEEELIQYYGRKGYDKNGILMNISLNSNPPSRKGKKLTEEQREQHKLIMKNVASKRVYEYKEPWNKNKKGMQAAWNKGLKMPSRPPMTEMTKKKLRDCNLGKTKSIETRQKMSENMKGRVPWNKGKAINASTANSVKCVFISPDNIKYHYDSVRKGCIEHKLPTSKMSQVKTGKLPNYKGWTIQVL